VDVKGRNQSGVTSRNDSATGPKFKRGLTCTDSTSAISENKASPLQGVVGKSTSVSSRNSSSRGKEAGVPKSNVRKGTASTSGDALSSKRLKLSALESKISTSDASSGARARVKRPAFALKVVIDEEAEESVVSCTGDSQDPSSVARGVSIPGASPSTLPKDLVPAVPVRKGGNTKPYPSSSASVSLEPYTGSVVQFQTDPSDDPFAFSDDISVSEAPCSADTGSSRLAKQHSSSGTKAVGRNIGTNDLGSRTESGASKGASTRSKPDYSRKRADGATVTLSPAKGRTLPGAPLESADSASDDMLHEIDALLEEGDGRRGLLGVASGSGAVSSNIREAVSSELSGNDAMFCEEGVK
jgi:hypothetical protein